MNSKPVIPAKAGTSLFSLKKIPAFAGMTVMLLFCAPALAAPFTYTGPEGCEFEITFPEKPFIESKCVKGTPCEEIVTYTQTVESSGVNFRLTCRKEDPKVIADLKPKAIRNTLEQMAAEAGLTIFSQDSALLDNDVKSAVTLATGIRNDRDIIYAGQIWLGKRSIMTVEGEMSGPQNKQAEEIYGNILSSLKSKNAPKKTP